MKLVWGLAVRSVLTMASLLTTIQAMAAATVSHRLSSPTVSVCGWMLITVMLTAGLIRAVSEFSFGACKEA